MISTIFGEKEVSDDMILHLFKQYLSKSEQQVVCEALGRPVEEWDNDDKDDEAFLKCWIALDAEVFQRKRTLIV